MSKGFEILKNLEKSRCYHIEQLNHKIKTSVFMSKQLKQGNQEDMSGTFLFCVPLRVGVFSIVIWQLMYGSVRIYLSTRVDDELRGYYYYMHFAGHCFSIGAAVILFLGLL